jgi:hypothetical protein
MISSMALIHGLDAHVRRSAHFTHSPHSHAAKKKWVAFRSRHRPHDRACEPVLTETTGQWAGEQQRDRSMRTGQQVVRGQGMRVNDVTCANVRQGRVHCGTGLRDEVTFSSMTPRLTDRDTISAGLVTGLLLVHWDGRFG